MKLKKFCASCAYCCCCICHAVCSVFARCKKDNTVKNITITDASTDINNTSDTDNKSAVDILAANQVRDSERLIKATLIVPIANIIDVPRTEAESSRAAFYSVKSEIVINIQPNVSTDLITARWEADSMARKSESEEEEEEEEPFPRSTTPSDSLATSPLSRPLTPLTPIIPFTPLLLTPRNNNDQTLDNKIILQPPFAL